MHCVPSYASEAHVAQVCQANAKITIRGTGESFVKAARLKQFVEPDKQV